MIRRVLERLRAWLFADMIRRLDVLDSRLIAIERQRGLPVEPPVPTLPPTEVRWGCGHRSISGASHPDGRDQCLDCHQEAYR